MVPNSHKGYLKNITELTDSEFWYIVSNSHSSFFFPTLCLPLFFLLCLVNYYVDNVKFKPLIISEVTLSKLIPDNLVYL